MAKPLPADIIAVHRSGITFVRLREKSGRSGRWSWRGYQALCPRDRNRSELCYRSAEDWTDDLNVERIRSGRWSSPAFSDNEVQEFTLYIPPEDILFDKAGMHDFVYETMGLELAKHCAYCLPISLQVDICQDHLVIRVCDLGMQKTRRELACREACVTVLLAGRRRPIGGMPRDLHTMLARMLWACLRHDPSWDAIESETTKRIKA